MEGPAPAHVSSSSHFFTSYKAPFGMSALYYLQSLLLSWLVERQLGTSDQGFRFFFLKRKKKS